MELSTLFVPGVVSRCLSRCTPATPTCSSCWRASPPPRPSYQTPPLARPQTPQMLLQQQLEDGAALQPTLGRQLQVVVQVGP
jgi:hypothetical protein